MKETKVKNVQKRMLVSEKSKKITKKTEVEIFEIKPGRLLLSKK